MRLHRLGAPVLAALLVAPVAGWAGPPTDQLREHTDALIRVLDDPTLKAEGRGTERQAAARRITTEIFDFTEIARRALGRHWQSRTPAEQQELAALFTDLLERSYVSTIERYEGKRISYLDEAIDGNVAVVRTSLTTKQGTDIPIEYRMLRRDDKWMVHEVVIEGVGLVANYRTQFNRIIQSCSDRDLMRCLRQKQPRQPEFPDLARTGA